jgi:branched-chain amino acid transport system ATP-binding protein
VPPPTDRPRTEDGLLVSGLTAGYGRAIVLEDLALDVSPAEVVGVAGANGAGKTTLLRVLTGLIPRTAGSVSFGGAELPCNPVKVSGRGVVHVPEGRQLFATLTVAENLKVGALAARRKDADLDRLLEVLPDLEVLLPRKAGVLSGGQQQLVAVARGLIAGPRLLLIDELSLGLSPAAAEKITRSAVAACRAAGTTLVLVDQNVHLLAAHCDRLLRLGRGRLSPLPHDEVAAGAALF